MTQLISYAITVLISQEKWNQRLLEQLFQTSKPMKNESFKANIRIYWWETGRLGTVKVIFIKVIKVDLIQKHSSKSRMRRVPGFVEINFEVILCSSILKSVVFF